MHRALHTTANTQTQTSGDKSTHFKSWNFWPRARHARSDQLEGVGGLWEEPVSISWKSKPGVSALQWGIRRALTHQWRANGPALAHTHLTYTNHQRGVWNFVFLFFTAFLLNILTVCSGFLTTFFKFYRSVAKCRINRYGYF